MKNEVPSSAVNCYQTELLQHTGMGMDVVIMKGGKA